MPSACSQPREIEQTKVSRHAGGAKDPERGRDRSLSGVKQPGIMPVRHAQLLQPAIEHHHAAGAEHVVTRLDDLAHAARWHHVARAGQVAGREVGGAAERVERQPQGPGKERPVGEHRAVRLDQLEVTRTLGLALDPDLEVAHR